MVAVSPIFSCFVSVLDGYACICRSCQTFSDYEIAAAGCETCMKLKFRMHREHKNMDGSGDFAVQDYDVHF